MQPVQNSYLRVRKSCANIYVCASYMQPTPGTTANHRTMISTYIAFCLHYKLEYITPKTATICMYAEFLTRSFSSLTAIRNYISATRLLHKYLHVGIHHCSALHSFELDLIIRAINITLRHTPNRRLPMDARMLRQLCILCDNLGSLGATLKVSFLFGYYAFLRQSNLAPRTARLFDTAD